MNDEKSINLGSVYESVVCSELVAHGFPLFYYDNKKKGEVEFLVNDYDLLSGPRDHDDVLVGDAVDEMKVTVFDETGLVRLEDNAFLLVIQDRRVGIVAPQGDQFPTAVLGIIVV